MILQIDVFLHPAEGEKQRAPQILTILAIAIEIIVYEPFAIINRHHCLDNEEKINIRRDWHKHITFRCVVLNVFNIQAGILYFFHPPRAILISIIIQYKADLIPQFGIIITAEIMDHPLPKTGQISEMLRNRFHVNLGVVKVNM